jgi:hypothetical protein
MLQPADLLELDHVFVCVALAELADNGGRLREFGLTEGPPNVHPGQGTANRRFSFRNSMLELLWVSDPEEARSPQTAPTGLYERWSKSTGKDGNIDPAVCPFGIILRPASPEQPPPSELPPFPAWRYQPDWLPANLELYIAEQAGLEEPMWVYMPFLRRQDREQHFSERDEGKQHHPNGVREITGLTLHTPTPLTSSAAQFTAAAGIYTAKPGAAYALSIEFDHGVHRHVTDLRPHLPLILER